ATFLLEGDAAYHPGFPFEYALRACYTLRDNALRADLIISNLDDRAFYFSAGAHEAYDCPGEMTDYFVEFDEDETLRNRVVADNGLIAEATEPVPMQGRVLPITPELFAHGTLVLDDLRSRGVTLGCTQNNRRVRVDFPGFDYLLIWKQKGASFLCIEPWHNLPDAVDTDGDIAKKPGMIRIAPGGSVTLTHTLTFF
ncbi:MAG: hypothetical protein LBM74_05545, partial [Oscillospiraceae bacterium]|nr:hypothetical protein [Oscillospiraceae bacterium]